MHPVIRIATILQVNTFVDKYRDLVLGGDANQGVALTFKFVSKILNHEDVTSTCRGYISPSEFEGLRRKERNWMGLICRSS